MPQANSTTSRPRCTSPRASESTLPCSSVISSASSSEWRLTSSRKANRIFARLLSELCDQSAKAASATCTASATSAADASATSACCWPVAGSNTGARRPPGSLTCLPPIQCSTIVAMLRPPLRSDRQRAGG